jgi:hypothetical protein
MSTLNIATDVAVAQHNLAMTKPVFRIRIRMDPHQNGKLDPDQNGKLDPDPDPNQSEKQDPDPDLHQIEK